MSEPHEQNDISDIGSLQIRVMRALWRRGDGTVHEVLEDFPAAERPAYTTILHVLRTLERRGLVGHVKQARQHRYRPLVDADAVEGGVVHSLLDRVFSGSAQQLVARLLETTPIDPQELESIRRLIDQREAELSRETRR
jgi:BlaI family penicillinase repressor